MDEGDWRGLSNGDGEIELGADESVFGLRCSAMRLGIADDDMVVNAKL